MQGRVCNPTIRCPTLTEVVSFALRARVALFLARHMRAERGGSKRTVCFGRQSSVLFRVGTYDREDNNETDGELHLCAVMTNQKVIFKVATICIVL